MKTTNIQVTDDDLEIICRWLVHSIKDDAPDWFGDTEKPSKVAQLWIENRHRFISCSKKDGRSPAFSRAMFLSLEASCALLERLWPLLPTEVEARRKRFPDLPELQSARLQIAAGDKVRNSPAR